MPEYDYDLTGVENKFKPVKFHREVRASLSTVLGVRVSGSTAYVEFPVGLSAEDETTLDGLFSAHMNYSFITAINRTTCEKLDNVKSTNYPTEDWIHDPNISALSGVSQKYWKVDGDNVVEMSQSEKDAVDANEAANCGMAPIFHASSVLAATEVSATDTDPDWTDLGGSVTTPNFFTSKLEACKGRVVGEVKTNGTGAKLRIVEKGSTPSSVYDVPDTGGVWQTMQWFSNDAPSQGTHKYTLEGQLPSSGATQLSVRCCAISLLEFFS